MYRALRTLNLGADKLVHAGDPVDVSGWLYPAIVANVNMGYIEKVEDTIKAQPEKVQLKRKKK